MTTAGVHETVNLDAEAERLRAEVEVARAEILRLRDAEDRLNWIEQTSSNLFYSHTPRHELTYLSPATRSFLDCEPAEAMVHWTEFATDNPVNAEGFAKTVRAINTGQAQAPYQLEVQGRAGRKVWVEVREVPVIRDGKVVAIVGSLTDVTLLKQAEDQLHRAQAFIENLQASNRAKARFASAAAHELFTPLTPMRVQLHLLLKGAVGTLTPEQTNALAILDRGFDRITKLVQDILDSARLQDQGLRLERAPMKLEKSVASVVEEFRLAAERAGIRLQSNLNPLGQVLADARRISQVVTNLLSNAIKYTPRGGTVTVETHLADGFAICRVADTGLGLAPDQIDRLFQPFSTLHESQTQSTGLGLYVCHGLIALHGGRLWCESAGPGKGSAFVFSLPTGAKP